MTEIRNVGTLDTALTGTELVPFQEAAGGASSTKRTTTLAAAALSPYFYNVKNYGATGDGSTDDATAINAAMTAAATSDASGATGGVVYAPKGTYKVNSQILVPGKVRFVGDNRSATYLIAGATFPTSTPLVRLGLGSGIVAGCTVEHMTIDCNNIAGSIGVYSTEIQEQSGVFWCSISKYRDTGLQYTWPGSGTGPPNNASAGFLEIYGSSSGSVQGVDINACGGKTFLENITVFPSATATGPCIHVRSSHVILNGAHGEASTDLVYFESGFGVVSGLYGQSTLSGAIVHIGASANRPGIKVLSVNKNSAAHTIVDDVIGVTIDSSPVATYPDTMQLLAGPANLAYTGVAVPLAYGTSLVPGDLVYMQSAGTVAKANATTSATAPVMGMAMETASSGTHMVLLHGIFRNDTRYNFTVGGPVYLSTTAGTETQTQPTATDNVIQVLGIATHADRIYFNPSLDYITHT